MSGDEINDETLYVVVVNGEEQYSIWAADRELPAGWQLGGFSGTRAACLSRIGEVWVDMTPRSVREHLRQARGD